MNAPDSADATPAEVFARLLRDAGVSAPAAPAPDPPAPRAPLPNPAQGASGRHGPVLDPAEVAQRRFAERLREILDRPRVEGGSWHDINDPNYY